jgi:uncharacterized membrane protein YfcA
LTQVSEAADHAEGLREPTRFDEDLPGFGEAGSKAVMRDDLPGRRGPWAGSIRIQYRMDLNHVLDTWSVRRSTGEVPPLPVILLIGAGVGFLGGLLGKGGSAIATPLLVAVGVPAMIAVAAPLPATVPGTLVAADRYRRHDLIDRDVLRWSILFGLPATVVGALLTQWVSGPTLVAITDVVVAVLGVRLLVRPSEPGVEGGAIDVPMSVAERQRRTIAVAVATGFVAGLLANSGGFLLAPLFITVLGLRVRSALGTSLVVAACMAVPGTLVHLALGHLDWTVVAVFGLGSIPLSGLGARVALKVDAHKLERLYGVALVLLGGGFVVAKLV